MPSASHTRVKILRASTFLETTALRSKVERRVPDPFDDAVRSGSFFVLYVAVLCSKNRDIKNDQRRRGIGVMYCSRNRKKEEKTYPERTRSTQWYLPSRGTEALESVGKPCVLNLRIDLPREETYERVFRR